MALFGRKKEADTAKEVKAEKKENATDAKVKDATPAKKAETQPVVDGRSLSDVIVQPRITEKAAVIGENNVYTFEVRRDATKYDVRDAIKKLFKVTPIKVNIVNRKPRHFISRMRGRKGVHPGMKKAYVYLKKGDTIDIV